MPPCSIHYNLYCARTMGYTVDKLPVFDKNIPLSCLNVEFPVMSVFSDESVKEPSRRESRRQSEMTPDYPVGSKLKIKYGKGKNQKVYEAKVRLFNFFCSGFLEFTYMWCPLILCRGTKYCVFLDAADKYKYW